MYGLGRSDQRREVVVLCLKKVDTLGELNNAVLLDYVLSLSLHFTATFDLRCILPPHCKFAPDL